MLDRKNGNELRLNTDNKFRKTLVLPPYKEIAEEISESFVFPVFKCLNFNFLKLLKSNIKNSSKQNNSHLFLHID